jgi:hypothetical protein
VLVQHVTDKQKLKLKQKIKMVYELANALHLDTIGELKTVILKPLSYTVAPCRRLRCKGSTTVPCNTTTPVPVNRWPTLSGSIERKQSQ